MRLFCSRIAATYLHPPFFSIVLAHFMHSFVFAIIQFEVSESSAHFFSHALTYLQVRGRWSIAAPQLCAERGQRWHARREATQLTQSKTACCTRKRWQV